jgi:hypothetical protein
MPTIQQLEAIKLIVTSIIETVRDAGDMGAPSGPMYAACMSAGASLSQYQSLMDALVRTGKLRQSGDLYFIS